MVSDGVCLLLGKLSEEVRRAGAAVPVEQSNGRVLGELFGEGLLASFVNGMRE